MFFQRSKLPDDLALLVAWIVYENIALIGAVEQ